MACGLMGHLQIQWWQSLGATYIMGRFLESHKYRNITIPLIYFHGNQRMLFANSQLTVYNGISCTEQHINTSSFQIILLQHWTIVMSEKMFNVINVTNQHWQREIFVVNVWLKCQYSLIMWKLPKSWQWSQLSQMIDVPAGIRVGRICSIKIYCDRVNDSSLGYTILSKVVTE